MLSEHDSLKIRTSQEITPGQHPHSSAVIQPIRLLLHASVTALYKETVGC